MYNRKYFVDLVKKESTGRKKMVVAAPHDRETIVSITKAYDEGLVSLILVGERIKITEAANQAGKDISGFRIVEAITAEEIANASARIICEEQGDLLMKGLIDTSVLLKAILKKEYNLRTGRLFSHVGVLFKGDQMYIITDAAMNIAPGLEEKKQIIENAIPLANALGIEKPKIAMLCAKEKPYEKMPATLDAQALKEMNERDEIKNCIISGPMQLDVAVNKHAAEIKGVADPVAGEAQILVAPTIEVANVFAKGLEYLGGYTAAGFIAGAKIPVVLVSRADGENVKMISIALACAMSNKN